MKFLAEKMVRVILGPQIKKFAQIKTRFIQKLDKIKGNNDLVLS
jgi:hypothetical protein